MSGLISGLMSYEAQAELGEIDFLGDPVTALTAKITTLVDKVREQLGQTTWVTGCVVDQLAGPHGVRIYLRFDQSGAVRTAEDVVSHIVERVKPLLPMQPARIYSPPASWDRPPLDHARELVRIWQDTQRRITVPRLDVEAPAAPDPAAVVTLQAAAAIRERIALALAAEVHDRPTAERLAAAVVRELEK